MNEDIQAVLITDGRDSILLFPPETYSDGHGLHHRVEIVCGPFSGAIDASSYDECVLQAFRNRLVILHDALKGEADVAPSYDNFKLSLIGDGMGHFKVSGVAQAINRGVQQMHGATHIATLEFEFVIDQTQLADIIRAMDRVLTAK